MGARAGAASTAYPAWASTSTGTSAGPCALLTHASGRGATPAGTGSGIMLGIDLGGAAAMGAARRRFPLSCIAVSGIGAGRVARAAASACGLMLAPDTDEPAAVPALPESG